MSKIRLFYDSISSGKYCRYLKFIQKGSFFILINEEAFYFAKKFSFKLTRLDKNNIKVGFPHYAKGKWIEKLMAEDISFVFTDKERKIQGEFEGKNTFRVDEGEYIIAYERVLALNKLNIEEKTQKNFLLKQKIEDLYKKLLVSIMKFPKKERFYIREKMEHLMLDILEDVYIFSYQTEKRKNKSKDIFDQLLIFRDFFRLAYGIGNYMKDTVYLDLSEDIIEILKICKTLVNKYDINNL